MQPGEAFKKRPLIGVPTGREKSQRFFGLPLYIMNQTYVRTLENLGALPVMIPLQMSEATLHGLFERLDGLFLPGGEDIDPSNYAPNAIPSWAPPIKQREHAVADVLGSGSGDACARCLSRASDDQCRLWRHALSRFAQPMPGSQRHDYFPPTYERYRITHQVSVEPENIARDLGTIDEMSLTHHQGIAQLGQELRIVGRADDLARGPGIATFALRRRCTVAPRRTRQN